MPSSSASSISKPSWLRQALLRHRPIPFDDPNRTPDATQNPKTNPIQMYHLGLWFDNPKDVEKLGGPRTVTPFNGGHDAGILVLNTGQFPDNDGPLKRITSN